MKYDEIVSNIGQVDEDQLVAAHGEAKARIAELAPKVADRSLTPDELTELRALKAAYTSMHAEVATRTEARDAAYGEVGDVADLIADPEPADEPEVTGNGSDEAAPEVIEHPVVDAPAEPVAASTPPMGSVTAASPAKPDHKSLVTITAAADSGYKAGLELEPSELGKAISKKLRALSNASGSGDGEQVSVVSITAAGIPEDRKLDAGDSAEQNTNKIQRVTSPQAITAAGGLCAPLAIDYNYGVWGVQGRPVKNALPGFQVERGGIQFRRDLSPMLNVAADGPRSATGFWTLTDDENAENPGGTAPDYADAYTGPLKALWVVDCPPTETAEIEAITLQIEFANITSRFDPETLRANIESALIWHDRICENHLLSQLQAKSKYMTSAQLLGATRDLLVNLDKVQAYYRSVHRLGDNITLKAIMPFWVKAMIRSDIARGMNTDSVGNLNVSDSQIESFFATRNVTPVWHLDGAITDQATSGSAGATIPAIQHQAYTQTVGTAAVPAFPTTIDMLLFPEGHFQHLDAGTLDLGIVRDADLIRRNRYRQFSESFEGLAARGVEALRYVASVLPNGAQFGTVAPATSGL